MQQATPHAARLIFVARERLVLGGHFVEVGDVLDYDPNDGSCALAASIPASGRQLCDLLDRGAVQSSADQDPTEARVVLAPETRGSKVLPIGPRLAVVR